MPAGPDAAEILEGEDGDISTTADEPAVAAAEPEIHQAARQVGVTRGSSPEAGVVADVDVPIAAAVVSTAHLS